MCENEVATWFFMLALEIITQDEGLEEAWIVMSLSLYR